jgi:hypothetical protein
MKARLGSSTDLFELFPLTGAGNAEMQQKFGSFKEKDCLVSLNGMELRTLEFDEAMRMINQSNVFRFLRVRREVYAPAFFSTQGSANSEMSPDSFLDANAPQGRRHSPDPPNHP